jgi:hypothetical protein
MSAGVGARRALPLHRGLTSRQARCSPRRLELQVLPLALLDRTFGAKSAHLVSIKSQNSTEYFIGVLAEGR